MTQVAAANLGRLKQTVRWFHPSNMDWKPNGETSFPLERLQQNP
jgi:hypothetical protein